MEFVIYRYLLGLLTPGMEMPLIPLRRHGIAHVEIYDVTSDELARMESSAGDIGVDFQIAQLSVTLAVSFLVALLTTTIESRKTFDIFVIIVVVGFVLALAFGLKWYQDRGIFADIVKIIRDRQIGPVGDEGKVLAPAELAELPSQKAGDTK